MRGERERKRDQLNNRREGWVFDWPVWILISVNWPQREMKAQREYVYVCVLINMLLSSLSPPQQWLFCMVASLVKAALVHRWTQGLTEVAHSAFHAPMRSTGFLVHPLNPGRVCIITILLFYYKTQTFTPLSSFNKQQMCEHMCKLPLRQSKHDNTLYKHTNLRFYLGALACNYRCFLLLSHIFEVQVEVCNLSTTERNCKNNSCFQKRFPNTPTSVVD